MLPFIFFFLPMQKIPLPHLAGLSALTLCIGLGTAFVVSNQTQASTALSPAECTTLYQKVYEEDAADSVSLEDRRTCNVTCKRIEIAYYNKESKTWKSEDSMSADDLAYKKSCKLFYERSTTHQAAPEKPTPVAVPPLSSALMPPQSTVAPLQPRIVIALNTIGKSLSTVDQESLLDLLRADISRASGVTTDRLSVVSVNAINTDSSSMVNIRGTSGDSNSVPMQRLGGNPTDTAKKLKEDITLRVFDTLQLKTRAGGF
jgi:hypothetical protein